MPFRIDAPGTHDDALRALAEPVTREAGGKPDPLGEQVRKLLAAMLKGAPAEEPGDPHAWPIRWHVHASGDDTEGQVPWLNVTVRGIPETGEEEAPSQ